MVDGWCGAVLTGGRSTRMGRDKALLPVDGVPMARRVVDELERAGAVAIACIGGDEPRLTALGLQVRRDEHPGEGPLGAIITALRWSPCAVTVIAPCDLVSPNAAAFERLVATLSTSAADAAVPIVDGTWRALPSVFRTACLEPLQDAFRRGERSIHRAVEALAFVVVDAGPLADADSPEDLKAAGRVVEP